MSYNPFDINLTSNEIKALKKIVLENREPKKPKDNPNKSLLNDDSDLPKSRSKQYFHSRAESVYDRKPSTSHNKSINLMKMTP